MREQGSDISLRNMTSFWGDLFGKDSVDDTRNVDIKFGRMKWSLIDLVTIAEVKKALSKMKKDGAAGPDLLDLKDLKTTNLEQLTAHFNLWLLAGYTPVSIREARTILIPKTRNPKEAAKFRPITISSIVIRLFHSILGRRIGKVLEYDPLQKGFLPGVNGVQEATALMMGAIQRAKKCLRPLAIF